MELTTEQLETLKSMDWQSDRGEDLLYFSNTNDSYFQNITGVCVSCLRDLLGGDNTMENFYWEIAYRFHKDTVSYDLHYAIWCKGNVVKDGVIQEFNSDVLGLFTKSEESDWRDILSYTLNQILQSESVRDIVDYIDNNFPSLSDQVREDCVNNLVASDIDDSLKEDIARDWIDDNSSEAFDRAWNNMDSYEIKDKIIDYLSDNL